MFSTSIFLLATSIHADAVTAPSRQPQLAVGHGQVAMVFGAGSSIFFTSSTDQGVTFAAPTKVAELGALALGRHRGPRLAILKDALVVTAVVNGKAAEGTHAHGLPENGNLAVWRSTDKGRTWKRTGEVNDIQGAAREGLHAMTVDAKGQLMAVWLDLREKGTRLYGARSSDGGATWSKNYLVYESPSGTICQCCHPTISIDEQGEVWVMWRNAVDGSRDLYVTNAKDGVHFGEARKLGEGTWKLEACPMDGGGLAVENGKVYSAWRRDGDVLVTGPEFAEKKLGTGKDVAIVRGRAGTYAAWTRDGGIQLQAPGAATPQTLAKEGGFVNLIKLPDGSVLAAWETKNSIETARVK